MSGDFVFILDPGEAQNPFQRGHFAFRNLDQNAAGIHRFDLAALDVSLAQDVVFGILDVLRGQHPFWGKAGELHQSFLAGVFVALEIIFFRFELLSFGDGKQGGEAVFQCQRVKLDAGEKDAITAAVKALEEVLKGEDKDAIDAKTTALMTASQKLGEKMYAESQAAQAAQAAGGADAAGASASSGKPADDDNVVDAEVKEVKKG